MSKSLVELLDNRVRIGEEPAKDVGRPRLLAEIKVGRILGSPDHTRILKDVQSNILMSHGFGRAHYFFIAFREECKPITQFLLGMLAHTPPERLAIRKALTDGDARLEMPTQELRDAARDWEARLPDVLGPDARELLADLRVVSEHSVHWRRLEQGPPKRSQNQLQAAARAAPEDAAPAPDQTALPPYFTVNVLLTKEGYVALDVPSPTEKAFFFGPDRPDSPISGEIADPDWKRVHALIIVAYDPSINEDVAAKQAERVDAFKTVVKNNSHLLFEETGNVLRTDDGRRIEPFGFKDGISQPIFYESQRKRLKDAGHQDQYWDPAATLDLVLCPDPNGTHSWSCGSYFVFRKLEQDVQRFEEQSVRLAKNKRWSAEELRARFVGRKLNGDPLVRTNGQNDFDFSDDSVGDACPFHAHVRKVNPRNDVPAIYEPKSNRIVRRSIPYGPRIKRKPDGSPETMEGADGAPTIQFEDERGEVGLLFMCAQSDIAHQFEHLQASWADRRDHPRGKKTAIDTVIGRPGPNRVPIDYKPTSDTDEAGRDDLSEIMKTYDRVVQFRGGGYFFAPSISFLRSLVGHWIGS